MGSSEKERAGRAAEILKILSREYPNARVHLSYGNAFELLVATILAAQCTDERVNKVTPGLFRKYPDAASLGVADQKELERLIRSTGFYRNKAKSLLNMARVLQEGFSGRMPESIAELVTLPGVGRKTANVVVGNCYGQPAIVVDTHLKRVIGRLELSGESDPDSIESDLREIMPPKEQTRFSLVINEHGRRVCTARKPLCPQCAIRRLCPYPEKTAETLNG